METKNKIVREWLRNNGGCKFNFKKQDIIFPDGGIWSIDKKIVKRKKITGFKPSVDGFSEVVVSKKKFNIEEYEGYIWIGELDELIEYLQSMGKMLNKIGYKTDKSLQKIKK